METVQAIDKRVGSLDDYIHDLPPGDYDAICVDVIEEHQVQRKKYGTEKMEKADVIRFLFEVTGASGQRRAIRSREFRFSLHEKSSLYQFIAAWMGQACDVDNELEFLPGSNARLTLDVGVSVKDPTKKYIKIVRIAPVECTGKVGEA